MRSHLVRWAAGVLTLVAILPAAPAFAGHDAGPAVRVVDLSADGPDGSA
jgi:hypothetical protein